MQTVIVVADPVRVLETLETLKLKDTKPNKPEVPNLLIRKGRPSTLRF